MPVKNQLPALVFRFGVDTAINGGGDTPGIVSSQSSLANILPSGSRLLTVDLGPNWENYSLATVNWLHAGGATASNVKVLGKDNVADAGRVCPYAFASTVGTGTSNINSGSSSVFTVRCSARYLTLSVQNLDATNSITFTAGNIVVSAQP